MSRPITFTIPGEPIPQGSKSAGVKGKRAVMFEANPKLKAWRLTMTLHARRYAGLFTGHRALHVTYVFRLTRPKTVLRWLPWVKPDLDKLIRAVNDSISNARVWDDDGRVTAITSRKRYADENNPPGVTITIQEDTL